MKKISILLSLLAILTMSPAAVPGANAAGLQGFSTTPALLNGVSVGGMPAWYQDQNGVAVQPCFDVAACGLIGLGDPNFIETSPLAFPGNFPIEAFYFNATTGDMNVGGATVFVIDALEYTFVDPITGAITSPVLNPAVLGSPFQRLRMVIKPAPGTGVALGTWTIKHPWGTATFDTATACRNTAVGVTCRMTRDLPLPGAVPANFVAALGATVPDSISTFLKAAAPPFGFLGNAVATPSVTGGALGNTFTVTDPVGNTATTGAFKILTGKLTGMEVTPISNDFGGVVIPATLPPVQNFTVTNLNTALAPAGNVTIGSVAIIGPNGLPSTDFVINPAGADTCVAGKLLPPSTAATPSTCTFTVAFNPKPLAPATEVAIRTARVNIIPSTVGAPTAQAALTGTAQYTMIAGADANGAITPAGQAIIVNAGATQNFTVTPNAKFQVKDITVDGALAHFVAPANPGAAVTFTAPAATANGTTINATFMPSGDLTADGKLSVDDAVKALRILVGLQIPVGDDLTAMKVAPLDATGRPSGTGAPDLNDVVLILKRVLGIITW